MTHGSPPPDPLLQELRKLWTTATEDSISHDLERARTLVGRTEGKPHPRAREYLTALEHLERWLHDM